MCNELEEIGSRTHGRTCFRSALRGVRRRRRLKRRRRSKEAGANELFLSTPLSFDDFTTDLVVFDKQGKLLARYGGMKNDPADWAVTKRYIIQAGRNGMLIYDRSNGQKIFDSKVNNFKPRYLYSMGGDMILACADETKFYILDLK